MSNKFYKASTDAAFKSIFCKKSNRDLLKRLLEESLEKPVVIESLGLPEVLKYNLSLRNKTLDAVVKTNGKTILVEMNSNNYKGLNIRNFAFACAKYIEETQVGESYNDMRDLIQLNYTCGLSKTYIDEDNVEKETPLVFKYTIYDKKHNLNFVKNITIYVFNVDKILDLCYNKGEEKYKFIGLLNADKKQLHKLSIGDDLMSKFEEELAKINGDEKFISFISAEEDARKVQNTILNNCKEEAMEEGLKEGLEKGIEQGLEQGLEKGLEQGKNEEKMNIAKKMLTMNFDIKDILEATGLTKKEIESLK